MAFGRGRGSKAVLGGGDGTTSTNSDEVPAGGKVPVGISGGFAAPGGAEEIRERTTFVSRCAGAVIAGAEINGSRGKSVAKLRAFASEVGALAGVFVAVAEVINRAGAGEERILGSPAVGGTKGERTEVNL